VNKEVADDHDKVGTRILPTVARLSVIWIAVTGCMAISEELGSAAFGALGVVLLPPFSHSRRA
jgi:hypothetical protein